MTKRKYTAKKEPLTAVLMVDRFVSHCNHCKHLVKGWETATHCQNCGSKFTAVCNVCPLEWMSSVVQQIRKDLEYVERGDVEG